MYTIRIEDDFAAAHYLTDYHGKCENLHGHNYHVRVWVEGENLDNGGMLLDFSVLKKALRETLKKLDHTSLNENAYFLNNPSAERIAKFIFDDISVQVPASLIAMVDVFETHNNMARYTP